eukprot:scaffold26237_cov107-Isochrysis_galbana.AAC.2
MGNLGASQIGTLTLKYRGHGSGKPPSNTPPTDVFSGIKCARTSEHLSHSPPKNSYIADEPCVAVWYEHGVLLSLVPITATSPNSIPPHHGTTPSMTKTTLPKPIKAS